MSALKDKASCFQRFFHLQGNVGIKATDLHVSQVIFKKLEFKMLKQQSSYYKNDYQWMELLSFR